MKPKMLIYLGMFLVFFQTSAQDPNFHVYLAFGQSNMEGHARIQPQDTINLNDRFKVLQGVDCPNLNREQGVWYTAKPPLVRCNTGLTPTDYFGREMIKNLPDSIQVGIINVAVGGCKIELFDKENYKSYVESSPDWLKNMVKEYAGNPYGRLVELAKIAQKDGVIKGILLHQGESNTGDTLWPKKVKGVYDNLIKDLRLDPENVPLLAGEMVSEQEGGACASMNKIIATLPEHIPNSHVVSSEGCEAVEDRLHFSAEGYRKLGKRYARKMLQTQGIKVPNDEQTKQSSSSYNPIIQTNYTADPAPMVYNGTLYLYTSHDEDGSTWFTMNDWKLFTTEDMVNWTDHGTVLSYKAFSWAKQNAWAPQAIERDGKFFMYVPLTSREGKNGIGVAVANSPYGPFRDPLGKPLISNSNADIDPTVFIDDDGQAYLFWGNPECYYVKLNEDMISIEGEISKIPNTIKAFGKREGKQNELRPTTYEEGPWLYKRNDLYHLIFAAGPIPEHIGYSTSKSITGPYTYQGKLMVQEGGSFTNHPGIVDFKGNTYFFYHNAALPGGSGFTRSVAVEKADFNDQGAIVQMKMTDGIKEALQTLNPFVKNEAETIAWSENVKAKENEVVGIYVTAENQNAYIQVREVDFQKTSPVKFTARVGTVHNGNVSLEVRLDSKEGKKIADIEVPLTGGEDRWELVTSEISEKVTGVHDVYFVFKGKAPSKILHFDYWMFSR